MTDSIGARIKRKRTELNLTQREVADHLFVTQQTVARWEDDKHLPPLKVIQDLSDFFKTDPSYFLGVDSTPVRHFNFLALFGSLVFNFLFFWIAVVFIVSLLLGLWGAILGCLVSPVILIWSFLKNLIPFSLLKLLISIILSIAATIISPLLYKLTIYIWKILHSYYLFNVNSIFYTVPGGSKNDK